MMQENEKKNYGFFCKYPENCVFVTLKIIQNANFDTFNSSTSEILDFLATIFAEMDSGLLN